MVKETSSSEGTREEGEEKQRQEKKKINFFLVTTIIFAILFLALLYGKISGYAVTGMTKEDAGKKVLDFVNRYLVESGMAKLVRVEEESGLYNCVLSYQGNLINIYVTKDGKYVALPGGLIEFSRLEEMVESRTKKEIPKTEKPKVELFVMSFCPYGMQAENLMKPVVELLGKKIEMKVRFIVNVQGDKIESVQSLHGIDEAKEDARQACIQKYYPDKYWNYLTELNGKCSLDNVEKCWKTAAEKLDIDIAKIEECAYGEGISILKEDEAASNKYGVRGSPTLIINGIKYEGSRNSEAYKQTICSAFVDFPEECSKELESQAETRGSGSC